MVPKPGERGTARQVVPIDLMHQRATRKKATGLTERERQLLLEEIAKISAELCDLQVWAAEITRRITNPPSARVDRTA
jgi:hypothetical protein